MFGCDKFCTYCIVPSVRGPEQSRPADEIEAEVRQLADQGCLEVTLLGPDRQQLPERRRAGGRSRLADLLEPAARRSRAFAGIKFVTNYPQDMTDDLLQAVRDLPQGVALPARAGAERLQRRAPADEARLHGRRVSRDARTACARPMPRRRRDQRLHRRLLRRDRGRFPADRGAGARARFKNSFIFKYSTRPGTKGAELYADDVPEEVKRRRNNELLAVQNAISEELNGPFLGRTVEMLVEGPSKVEPRSGTNSGERVQLTGRTVCDRIVVFDGPRDWTGQLLPVRDREDRRVHAVRRGLLRYCPEGAGVGRGGCRAVERVASADRPIRSSVPKGRRPDGRLDPKGVDTSGGSCRSGLA